MTLALRIAASVPLWLLRLATLLVLAVLGVPVIYLLASQGWCWPTHSKRLDRTLLQFPLIAWPWCNFEDGVDGLRGGDPAQQWWSDKTADWSPVRRIFVWSALRNPVDSLRWVPVLNPKIDPARVRFIGMDHEPAKGEGGWYFAWQGIYSCLRYETKKYRCWIGWKLKPSDIAGLPVDDVRAIRCDFAAQLKKIAS